MSDELMQAIHLARSIAITHHQPTILCSSVDNKTCSDQWQENYIILNNNEVQFSFQHANHEGTLHWRNFPAYLHYLQFFPDGLPHFQNGTFWYCQKNSNFPAWAIMLNQSGRARMIYPNAKGAILDENNNGFSC